jgi:polyisoprenoid-binding protein YceI
MNAKKGNRMRKIVFAVLGLALAGAVPVSAQSVSKDATQAPAGTYTVNDDHTQVLFSILHLGLTEFHGRFDRVSGTLTFDGTQPERSALSVTIDTTRLDTTSVRLNNDLKAVFRTQQFPTAVFKSTAITRTGADTGRISGTLTLRDVTKPVILDVTFNGGRKPPLSDGYSLGFHANGTIRRSDFGLDQMIWSHMVGDEVNLTIEAQFDQQKS